MTGPDSAGLKPLKIGDIELTNRVLLAPMSGVTDAPFRRLAARLGAGLVVSEMTASDDLVNGKPMSFDPPTGPVGRARRDITDEVMAAIRDLSGQSVADEYNELSGSAQ